MMVPSPDCSVDAGDNLALQATAGDRAKSIPFYLAFHVLQISVEHAPLHWVAIDEPLYWCMEQREMYNKTKVVRCSLFSGFQPQLRVEEMKRLNPEHVIRHV